MFLSTLAFTLRLSSLPCVFPLTLLFVLPHFSGTILFTMPTSTTSSPPLSPRRALLFLLLLFFLLYLVDSSVYRLRIWFPRLGPATSSIHRIRVLAIPAKGNKIEYRIDALHPEEDLPCTHSLFPHSGIKPCWYVTKHASDPISM
jgi:hypothetical protein